MDNLALTTLVIILLSVPGHVFRVSYNAGRFTQRILPDDITQDILKALIYAFPFHLIGIATIDHLVHAQIIKTELNSQILGRLLTAEYGSEFKLVIDALYHSAHQITVYLLSLTVLAWLIGSASRQMVWYGELDVCLPTLFGYGNRWMYAFTGRGRVFPKKGEIVLPYIDALVDVCGKCKLYRGVFYDFSADENGEPLTIFLIAAHRGKFREEKGKQGEFYWVPIRPGDVFMIKYEEIKNLNVSYFVGDPSAKLSTSPFSSDPPPPSGVRVPGGSTRKRGAKG